MNRCPNECPGTPVLAKSTGRFHGNTTHTWECPTCGERWTTTVAGTRELLGPSSAYGQGAKTVHQMAYGEITSVTAAREVEEEDE